MMNINNANAVSITRVPEFIISFNLVTDETVKTTPNNWLSSSQALISPLIMLLFLRFYHAIMHIYKFFLHTEQRY